MLEATAFPATQVNGEPAMLTRLVASGTQKLKLRDEKGTPAWEQDAKGPSEARR
jgi:hypothetical protein